MTKVKKRLLKIYGSKCMLCGHECKKYELEHHHIKPRYAYKREGIKPDNSVENGSLLCSSCHGLIHQFDWNSKEFQALTFKLIHNKEREQGD